MPHFHSGPRDPGPSWSTYVTAVVVLAGVWAWWAAMAVAALHAASPVVVVLSVAAVYLSAAVVASATRELVFGETIPWQSSNLWFAVDTVGWPWYLVRAARYGRALDGRD